VRLPPNHRLPLTDTLPRAPLGLIADDDQRTIEFETARLVARQRQAVVRR
jgi:hypothetical protein